MMSAYITEKAFDIGSGFISPKTHSLVKITNIFVRCGYWTDGTVKPIAYVEVETEAGERQEMTAEAFCDTIGRFNGAAA